ncbi:DUF1778 domain-containing protein [Actinomadura alba]|uniref:DUF1778 domain-containing protein n=1 Tax=Actinomadura alba TaxID=406431 RepID=A0ABR7LHG5_9ACTN|nr:DUF1778 domain-containing protein [Actinomadura alba]MBC6464220.1 DUF1778 domain-containing protein [Actinomadura alba]
MTASAQHHLPFSDHNGIIGIRTTADQDRVIRRAAELSGWTVSEFVLCAVLDRAEREVHAHAARVGREGEAAPSELEPMDSIMRLLGEL